MTFERSQLIIFVKNPELGKVKTRLAATIGDEAALEVYLQLLEQTNRVTGVLPMEKVIYYSQRIDDYDLFQSHVYRKDVQEGDDLGDRMLNAFRKAFEDGHERVVIIGSDCYELTSEILLEAFSALDENDAVIGPAKDGGYYLLGMRSLHEAFFRNKKWSTENVILDTMLDIQQLSLSYHLLPTLSDVDHEEDLNSIKIKGMPDNLG